REALRATRNGRREPRGAARVGGLPRRRGPSRRGAAMPRERGGVCSARARVVRGAPPDAGRPVRARASDTWREIEEALKAFEGPDGFAGPCELLVGAGTH